MRAYLLLFAAPAAWTLAAGLGLWRAESARAIRGEPNRSAARVVGSEDCRRCHPQEHQSWAESHHRRMTQSIAAGAEVYAPFAGEHFDYAGFRATMSRTRAGVPHIEVVRIDERGQAGELILDADVVYTVGSHRYQQYVGQTESTPGVWHRLPVAWHRGEGRWIHMNGAFVEPEGEPGDPEAYLRHVTRWNDNCVFCHNTEPSPGLEGARFETTVGEVGIACEACHGRGEAHVAWQSDAFVRLSSKGDGDPAITHPDRLTHQRETEVCGRCHGNRIAHRLSEVLAKGDGFTPGEDLSRVSRPIFRDSTLQGTEGTPFAARFWPDGTPRLSAYEMQAQSMSACQLEGELRCGSCHTMHGDEPDMQLRPGRRDAPCAQCHSSESLSAGSQHGAHPSVAEGGPDCLDCHMPRVVYGLLEGMITHRITSPAPDRLEADPELLQPDACTRCHVDRSRTWVSEAMPDLRRGELLEGADASDELSRIELELLAGDPLVRNLAAHALARSEASGERGRRRQALLEGLDDLYPSVRWFSWRGLRQLDDEGQLEGVVYDYLAPPEERARVVRDIAARVGPPLMQGREAKRDELVARSDDSGLWIGE